MRLFMSLPQIQALYRLIDINCIPCAGEEEVTVILICKEIRLKLLKRFFTAVELQKRAVRIKFKPSEVAALRFVLSRMDWMDPLTDSVRVYVLMGSDALL